ncbi:MAG: hypothetical protein FWF24_02955 [Alphaproteobacteria bacterium]|nr:hypothetical protein [Alphaproteobacteria bacterium]
MGKKSKKSLVWQGVIYTTFRAAAQAMAISEMTLRGRWRKQGCPNCLDGLDLIACPKKINGTLPSGRVTEDQLKRLAAIRVGTWERANL